MLALFTDHGLLLELLFTFALFYWWMERRQHFLPYAIVSVIVFAAVSFLWSFLPFASNAWTETARYAVFCMAGIGVLYACFRISWKQATFYATAACVGQHFAFKAATAIADSLNLTSNSFLPYWFFYALGFIFCILLLAAFFTRMVRSGNTRQLNRTIVVLLLGGMLLFTSLFQNLFLEYIDSVPVQLRIVFDLFDLICCLFLLSLMAELGRRGQLEYDNQLLKHVLHQQKQQMETSKETIDLINIKCHDLKHQLSRLRSRISESEIQELTECVNIYGAQVNTGNEAADVILTEKNLLCSSNGIQLDYMVDGTALSLLSPADTYALLGNILDNAIEAVRQLPPADRQIEIKIRNQMGMLSVHSENPYTGTLSFIDGLPVTTKQDKQYHGFGVKSIRFIVQKYSGFFSLRTENQRFVLDILFPEEKEDH